MKFREYFLRSTRTKNDEAWERDVEDHYVYIMGHLENGCLVGPSKVGISKHPEKRLRQVQSVEPGRLVLVGRFGFWRRDHALWVEQAFHRVCAVYRVRGGWFDMEPVHAVGVMSQNLQAFAADHLGLDDPADFFTAYDYLRIPGGMLDIDFDAFGHHLK